MIVSRLDFVTPGTCAYIELYTSSNVIKMYIFIILRSVNVLMAGETKGIFLVNDPFVPLNQAKGYQMLIDLN